MPQDPLAIHESPVPDEPIFVLGGWLQRGTVSYDRQKRVYFFAGEDGARVATADTLPKLAELLAEKRPPRQIAVNLKRRNIRSIRKVLNVGESVTEFVRVAVLGECCRRRVEDQEGTASPAPRHAGEAIY